MIKAIVKKIIGEKKIKKYKSYRERKGILRYETSYASSPVEEVWLKNVILAHSIEKSMAINDMRSLANIARYRTGIKNAQILLDNQVSIDSYAVSETMGVICAAIKYCTQAKMNINMAEWIGIQSEVDDFMAKYKIGISDNCGIKKYMYSDLTVGKQFDWIYYSSTRHSIRAYTDRIIDKVTIEKIIDGTKYYPSACNRQPCKVYYSQSEGVLTQLSTYINDVGTVKDNIHNFFIVTCDRRKFMNGELYQNYINGGIFLAYLVLSIHAQGLGSCIFQYIQYNRKDSEFRQKFGIPKEETIIAFVGFGEMLEEEYVLCAARQGLLDSCVELK